MDPRLAFVDRLLQFERRINRIYRNWAANKIFSAALRSFWEGMADDEQEQLKILERSASLLSFASAPPLLAPDQMMKVEAAIAAAERFAATSEPDIEGTLSHALALECSEFKELDDIWLTSFQPDVGQLTQGWTHAHENHLQRLYQAICRFTHDEKLHKEAGALLSRHQPRTAKQGR